MKKTLLALLILLITIFFAKNSYAERILQTNGFAGTPILLLKDGNVQSCGLNIVGVTLPALTNNPASEVTIVEFSFLLDRNGVGMVKALLSSTTLGNATTIVSNGSIGENDFITKNFNTFWIKPYTGEATKSVLKNGIDAIDGENKGSRLYPTSFNSVGNIYLDAMLGKPIMVGYKFKNGTEDFAVSSPVEITDEEKKQIHQCMTELESLMKSDTSKK